MPAARYWRIVGLESYDGGDLELSELHLYGAGGRLDDGATLTCTVAPSFGTLAALKDDDVGTTCRFAGAAVRAGGFALAWDFGAAPADVIGLRLGAVGRDVFLSGCMLQHSSDGLAWEHLAHFSRYGWPGSGQYTAAPTVGDANFAAVSLLLHMDGADGATLFADSSSTPKTVTAHGGASISTVQSKFGGAAMSVVGAGSGAGGGRLLVADSPDFDVSTGDFTLEMFCRASAFQNTAILFNKANGTAGGYPVQVYVTMSGSIVVWSYSSGGMLYSASTADGALPVGAWRHLAFTRHGSDIRIFVDGVLSGATSYAGSLPTNAFPVSIGAYSEGQYGFTGHIDEVRFTKGVARYITAFSPPNAPFQDSSGGEGGAVFLPPAAHAAHLVARIAASAPVHAFSTSAPSAIATARDVEFGGAGVVSGTVKRDADPVDLPMRRRVRLFDERSGLLVREAWSEAATGAYSFAGLDATRTYTVVAYDHEHHYRAVIADNMTPEAAP